VADYRLQTVEQEASAAHTISYTTAIALLAALAAEIGGDDETLRSLEGIPDHLAFLLGQEASRPPTRPHSASTASSSCTGRGAPSTPTIVSS
jgi:fructoselysine-6-P-deglycase FrlB-like protein